MTAFFQSFSSLAADPSNASLRTGVLSAAQSLAATFNQVSSEPGTAALGARCDDCFRCRPGELADQRHRQLECKDQRQQSQPAMREHSKISGNTIFNSYRSLLASIRSRMTTTASPSRRPRARCWSRAVRASTSQTQSSDGVTHLLLGGVDQTSALTNGGGQIGGALEARDSIFRAPSHRSISWHGAWARPSIRSRRAEWTPMETAAQRYLLWAAAPPEQRTPSLSR